MALVYPPPPWDVSFRRSQQAISAQPNDDVQKEKEKLDEWLSLVLIPFGVS